MQKFFPLLLVSLFIGCKSLPPQSPEIYHAKSDNFKYSGRTIPTDEGMALINSGASVSTLVYGDSIAILFENGNENHHYVSIQLNNEYLGRFRIGKDTLKLSLTNKKSENRLKIFKDTEAANGSLIFKGAIANTMESVSEEKELKIEFIGNSITCGYGADMQEIPCGEGEWYDQHNAYLAYGPRVARTLGVDYELTCVSGMGMYRNWNDEDQPVMPDVYESLFLDGNNAIKNDFSQDPPDIVSIALGTNDLSEGDGKKKRSDFSSEKFTENYIEFIKNIYGHYPNVKIALLTSPMLGTKKNELLAASLKKVKNHFPKKNIVLFEFPEMELHGCGGHPSIKDQRDMAAMLLPFYKNLLYKK